MRKQNLDRLAFRRTAPGLAECAARCPLNKHPMKYVVTVLFMLLSVAGLQAQTPGQGQNGGDKLDGQVGGKSFEFPTGITFAIFAQKMLFRSLLFGLLLGVISATGSRVQALSCRSLLTAEGRYTTKHPSTRAEQIARTNAVKKWEQLAGELYGSSYSHWRAAKNNSIECDRLHGALSGRISCVASAEPCA
jgi:hypothetical protein